MTETKPTLLVVDDTATNIDILLDALGEDYAVRVATDGEAALNSVKKFLPDLILLDIMMPGMDGYEVCRRLKEENATQDIPIIFLTSLSEDADEARGFALGAVDYITKPFSTAIITARVRNHLELRRQKLALQQSYDKLRELEALRDSLVHMIVHDMRSPLAGIIGNLQLVKMKQQPGAAADRIGLALSSTETLMEMISTLLDVSKMEEGKMTLDLLKVDILVLVNETIVMVEPLQGQRQLTIISPSEIEAIACDAQMIRRVLQNLIVNAIKFTDREKGVVTVSIENVSTTTVRVSVADDGPGIPPEYCEQVFDKFYQVEACREGQGRSTGLGLTFCKLAIEAHGGRIGLKSDMGKGSKFWFELPIN